MRKKPIGIFDSGIGGLTVVREIINLLPDESIVYLGDTARVPYGIRSRETVLKYAIENTLFLKQTGVKLLVVACNTVSAAGLEVLEQFIPVKTVGVLKPGVRAAVSTTRSGRIGIIGTEGTIRSGAYQREILQILPDAKILAEPCPLFVPLVEEGILDGPITDLIIDRYLNGLKRSAIDTLVLGCTHYPLLKKAIADYMGDEVMLIDSAIETSKTVKKILLEEGLLNDDARSERKFYVTDSPERFKQIGRLFLGDIMNGVEQVSLPEKTEFLTEILKGGIR
ncbi:MAG: glutamate racemase [Nitrospirae bacterium]|nr:MAG: glutamate racemase [Nitrospirota bacterium]